MAPPGPAAPTAKPARADREPGRWTDRVLGVLLGLVLGIGIVTAFVFLGSEDTIDAPRLDQAEQTRTAPSPGGRSPGAQPGSSD